ncbi:MAG: hypothetical protein RR412_06660 [Burkholderiaceae bacterium]
MGLVHWLSPVALAPQKKTARALGLAVGIGSVRLRATIDFLRQGAKKAVKKEKVEAGEQVHDFLVPPDAALAFNVTDFAALPQARFYMKKSTVKW